jgi:hypothetical protein
MGDLWILSSTLMEKRECKSPPSFGEEDYYISPWEYIAVATP